MSGRSAEVEVRGAKGNREQLQGSAGRGGLLYMGGWGTYKCRCNV